MFAALLLAFLRIRISVYHQNVQTTGLFPRVLDESTLSCAFLQVPSSPDLLAMQRVVLPPLSAKAAWALTSVFPWRPFISSPGGGPWALFMSAALPASETIICLGAWKVCRQLLTDSCRPWMPAKELTRHASAGPTGHVCEKYLASVPSLSVGVPFGRTCWQTCAIRIVLWDPTVASTSWTQLGRRAKRSYPQRVGQCFVIGRVGAL